MRKWQPICLASWLKFWAKMPAKCRTSLRGPIYCPRLILHLIPSRKTRSDRKEKFRSSDGMPNSVASRRCNCCIYSHSWHIPCRERVSGTRVRAVVASWTLRSGSELRLKKKKMSRSHGRGDPDSGFSIQIYQIENREWVNTTMIQQAHACHQWDECIIVVSDVSVSISHVPFPANEIAGNQAHDTPTEFQNRVCNPPPRETQSTTLRGSDRRL